MRKTQRYQQRYVEDFVGGLERVKQVQIMELTDETGKALPFVANIADPVSIGAASQRFGVIACQDPTQAGQWGADGRQFGFKPNIPINRWLVLVPKYLTTLDPTDDLGTSDSLKENVCPAYRSTDPLFVGRLEEPLYVGPIDKNGNKLGSAEYDGVTHFVNTHPLIVNAMARSAYAQSIVWDGDSMPGAVQTSKHRLNNTDTRHWVYYVDLNVDGRSRCAGGGTVVQSGEECSPNVWL